MSEELDREWRDYTVNVIPDGYMSIKLEEYAAVLRRLEEAEHDLAASREREGKLREAGNDMFYILTRTLHALETEGDDVTEISQDADRVQQAWAALAEMEAK